LDIIKKNWRTEGKYFSQKLQSACNNANVSIDDLNFTMLGSGKSTMFRFTKTRNSYIHDGFQIDDYGALIDDIRKMRALTERLLVALMGLDYRHSPIGTPTV
jgi:hypothetical protein